MLSTCELIERPSKKDGFCFKLFHPMDMSIWASRVRLTLNRAQRIELFQSMESSVQCTSNSSFYSKGPEGEAIGAVSQPLPTSHLIFR